MNVWRPWLIPTIALLSMTVGGCSGPNEGRFVGWVTPDRPGCRAGRGVLVAQAGKFLFTPSEGVIVLRGEVSSTGELHGAYETSGPDHQPVVFQFDGLVTAGHIEGILRQPGCRATVTLQPG